MQKQQSRILNQAGMTLLEIMIVLAIVGGLMAVLLPQVMKNLDKSKVSQSKLTMGQVINALNLFYTDCGKFPSSLDGLTAADANCSNWGPEPYMKKVPMDAWGNGFVYEGSGGTYNLKSLGSDGKEGGDGYKKDLTSEEMQ